MTVSLQDLKIIAEVVALAAAGVASLVGLIVLKRVATASANLKKLALETEQIELAIRKRVRLNVDVEAEVVEATDGDGHWILAVVTLENLGNYLTKLAWQEELPAFWIRKVTFDESGIPKFEKALELRVARTKDPNEEPKSTIIRAGTRQQLRFSALVRSQGLYLLSFRAVLDQASRKEAEEAGFKTENLVWTASRYLIVESRLSADPSRSLL